MTLQLPRPPTKVPSSEQRGRRPSSTSVIVFLVAAGLIYIVGGPLVTLLVSSFKATDGTLPFDDRSPWSLANYEAVFLSGRTYEILWNTIVFSAGSILVSFAITVLLAWLIERTDMPLRRTSYVLVIAQLGIPAIILNISWTFLLNPQSGYLNVALRSLFGIEASGVRRVTGPIDIYSMGGMIFVQAISMVPITLLLISAAFRTMNIELEEAAAVSGARFRTIVRRITGPVLLPALLSAAIYQLVTVLETLDTPLIIGLRAQEAVLSSTIYLQVQSASGLPDYGLASTYSIFTLLIVMAPMIYYGRFIARAERYAVISGRGYRKRRYSLGRAKWAALGFTIVFLLISFVLPVGALLWTSLQPYVAAPSADSLDRLEFGNFAGLTNDPTFLGAIWNTIQLGIGTGVATMLFGALVAWVIVRSRSRWARPIDMIAFLPHAFPGVIIGFSVLLIYLILPIPLYGTVWIIALALLTQYIALSTRLMNGAIVQVGSELEEAADVSGAPRWQTLRRIVLPLVWAPMLNGFVLIFLASIKNLTMPLLLYGPDSVVLSTLVWVRWSHGAVPAAAAVGVIMVGMTLIVTLLTRHEGQAASLK